jgi:putative endonuclease
MFYTYFLKSGANGDLYIGSCEDLIARFKKHNQGHVKSTKPNRPWKLMGYEVFNTRSEAYRREKFLKTGQQKEVLKKKFDND